MLKILDLVPSSRRTGALAILATAASLAACASAPRAPEVPDPAELIVVEIKAVDDSPEDAPDHVVIKPGCHMVTQRVCSSADGSSVTGRGSVQAVEQRDDRCVLLADEIEVAPGTNVVWAPTVIVRDGHEAQVFLGSNAETNGATVTSGLTATMTVRPAGAGFELEYRFEELRDGVVVSEIPATRIPLAEGQAVALKTTRR